MHSEFVQTLIKPVLLLAKNLVLKATQLEPDPPTEEENLSAEFNMSDGNETNPSKNGILIYGKKIATGIVSTILVGVTGVAVTAYTSQDNTCIVTWKRTHSSAEITSETCKRVKSIGNEIKLDYIFPNQKHGIASVTLGEQSRKGSLTSGRVTINGHQGLFTFDHKNKLFKASLKNGEVFDISNLSSINK